MAEVGKNLKSGLTKTWVKASAIILTFGGVVTAGAMSATSHGGEKAGVSLAAPPAVNATPGDPGNPMYAAAVRSVNIANAEEAKATGGSAMPTPQIQLAAAGDGGNPLDRWQSSHPDRHPLPPMTPPTPEQGLDDAKANQLMERLQQAMARRMEALDKERTHMAGPILVSADTDGPAAKKTAKAGSGAQAKALPARTLRVGGQVYYAENVFEVVSDVKSPIKVTIMAGPFAGCDGLGSFENSEEYLIGTIKNVFCNASGKAYDVDAILVDPNSQGFAIADDVDHHYLESVILPSAAAFVSSFGNAMSQTATTTTMSPSFATTQTTTPSTAQALMAGAGGAANAISTIMQSKAQKLHNTVYLYANKPVGLLFLRNVEDKQQ